MLRAVCDVCNCKKNKFIKKQESKGIIAVNCQCIFKYFVLNVKTEILCPEHTPSRSPALHHPRPWLLP